MSGRSASLSATSSLNLARMPLTFQVTSLRGSPGAEVRYDPYRTNARCVRDTASRVIRPVPLAEKSASSVQPDALVHAMIFEPLAISSRPSGSQAQSSLVF